jgi:hypothetical protein
MLETFSRLAAPEARRAASRWLLAGCAGGAIITILFLAATGRGTNRWLFVVMLWGVIVFMPLWILIQSAQGLGAGARRALAARIARDPARYERAGYLPLAVERLAGTTLPLPRICLPRHRRQAIDAAVALIERANHRVPAPPALWSSVRVLLVAVGQEAAALSGAATGATADNIQARWDAARALGALGAVVSLLEAVHSDRWGSPPPVPELEGRDLREFLAAVLDYCDEAALEVDAMPWTEPPLPASAPLERLREIRETWRAFLAAGTPAPRTLEAFVDAVVPETSA